MKPSHFYIQEIIKKAIEEDMGGRNDRTASGLFSPQHKSTAVIISKEQGIFCGEDFITQCYSLIANDLSIKFLKRDGEHINKNDIICEIQTNTIALLTGERVVLNFISRLSGISTLTTQYVNKLNNKCTLLCTRKTTPNLRVAEKYACWHGGALNHRFGLDDMIMIKDNHIKAFGGIKEACQKLLQKKSPFCKIEIEVDNIKQLLQIIDINVDIILLDNFSITNLSNAVNIIKEHNKLKSKNILCEASGNITLQNINSYANSGVDFISTGAITHHATWHDFSLAVK